MNTIALVKAALFTPGAKGRWGLPLIFEGQPGCGKTGLLEQTVEAVGLDLTVLIGSLREPSDFLGLPVPMQNGGDTLLTAYAVPAWAYKTIKHSRGVVFLDEINSASPAVQSAMLRVVLDGVVGDLQLPAGIRFIAAMNSTQDAAGGWDLAPPLANRFGHIRWTSPTVEEWTNYIIGGATDDPGSEADASAIEARVTTAWPNAWAGAAGMVAGFMARRPELLHKMPAATDPQASKAWPSHRSWESATRAIASAVIHRLDEVTADALIAAFVGDAVAVELATWRTEADLPDPLDVLDGKISFQHNPARLDRTAAVFAACAAQIRRTDIDRRSEQWQRRGAQLWSVIESSGVADRAPDLAIAPAHALVHAQMARSAAGSRLLTKLQPVITAAMAR